jgi:biotin carboxyl carrier protein
MSRARRAVATAQQGLDSLKAKLKETKMLLDKGIVARSEYTDLQEQLQSHQFQLDEAHEDLNAAQARGDPQTLRVAGFEFASAETKAKELEDDLSKAVIAAPVAGVVLQPPEEVGAARRAERVEIGAHVTKGQTIVSIGNLESYSVKASIDEIDINKLRVGQPVTVTGEAFEGMTLAGTVTSVAAQAGADPTGAGGMRVFPITIAIAAPSAEERRVVHVGMSATLAIVTYDKPDAIVLPPAAIHLQGNSATVTIRTLGSAEIRTVPVKLGVTTPDGVEIREGVAAGDTVVTGG